MALKDLFGKTSEQVVVNTDLDKLYKEAESEGYVEEALVDKERFLPNVDFSQPSNFARYGSAERYYVDGFKNIYENYPYDGSKKEKQEWRNHSSQLDLYLFDNVYPRTSGYVNLESNGTLGSSGTYRSGSATQYIRVKGGPNKSTTDSFNTANLYDLDTNRESNLGITSYGNTVEFWFKDNLTASNPYYTNAYALFDLWNGESSLSASYTRLTLEKVNGLNKFAVTYRSGSAGITAQTLDYTFDSSTWHHYAFSFANSSTSDLDVCLYVDGNLAVKTTFTGAGGINLANNLRNIAHIGALRNGLGTSCGSFDEFRFWKVARTSQQIYRNWFTSVGGGSNTDDANTDLGLYLKFNEGIVDDANINDLDKICLDYSGRVSNGTIINYNLNCRSTSSAIDEYYGDTKEQKDPIVFSSNPLVQQAIATYSDLGYQHDTTNSSAIYTSIPSWVTEEAGKNNFSDLSYLVQIISSYFDTLHLQIESLTSLKDIKYVTTEKPKPFTKNLLSSNGFENLEIFNDASFLENLLSRNEKQEFSDKLYNVKNAIYQNIYNNLAYIYKSKGTEKSLRNLIRCFGVDDELVKINVYANNAEYDIDTKYSYTSIPKKFVDFNNPDRYEGFIYQKSKSGDANTKGYIPGSTLQEITYVPITAQAEVIFPKRPIIESSDNSYADFVTSSIFGVHQANSNESILGWGLDHFNFQVYSERRIAAESDAKFRLVGSFSGSTIDLDTDFYKDVYNNEKWNFAVRIKPEKYNQVNLASGSSQSDYIVEFVGINSVGDSVANMFSLSASVPYAAMSYALKENKRVYAGAHYVDFDSTQLLNRTDVKIGSVRFWLDYLNDEELIAHSYETNNFGRQQPNWLPTYAQSALSQSVPLSRIETLALHWNFFNVTSSDSSGQFIVDDISSGSVAAASNYGYTWLNNIIRYQMPGFADAFLQNDLQVINKEYVFAGKKQNFETLNGNDLVKIVDTDDVTRTKDSRAISYYISIEKSMAQVINDEIMNWFATIKAYNNLIGEPAERYKQEYDGLRHLRELFFSRVNNSLNFEKFFEFYKWIDSSLSMMINQLVPASANASDKVRNIIESHMLERNKYENKLPSIKMGAQPKSYPISSGLSYKYSEQAANGLQQENKINRYYTVKPQWLKQRAIRTEAPVNTPLEPQNDIDREIIRQVANNRNIDPLPKLSGSVYDGRQDVTRIFTDVYKLTTERLNVLEDAIIPTNIENIPVQGRFIFAEEVVASSSTSQVIPVKQKYNRIGNYQRPYETVFVPGRTNNNKSFIQLEGNVSSLTNQIPNIDVSDRSLPVRSVNKNIIVERFSAPGGREVSSRGYLDPAAEEYSVYNSLNHRNSAVRNTLNTLLAQSASIDENNPSYHQVNKNPSYSPDPETSARSADYDNWFIQHQIPQSDQQYAWITASLSSSFSASAYISDFDNLKPNYEFLSVEKITANDNIVNTASNTIDHNNYADFTASNGAFEWPSWKQIRTYENPLVLASRKNNKILVQDVPREGKQTQVIDGKTYVKTIPPPVRSNTFTAYREPPVGYNKPMEHEVFMSGSVDLIKLTDTYENNKMLFANQDLLTRVGREERNELQTHDVLEDLDKNGTFTPRPEIRGVKYSAQAYPSNRFVGLADIRTKPNYDDDVGNTSSVVNTRTFWRDAVDNRARASITKDIYDFGYTSYSVLPENKILISYNDEQNNVVEISGANNIKESILAQDKYLSTLSGSFNYEPPESLKHICYINENGDFKQLGKLASSDIYAILSTSSGIYVGGYLLTSNNDNIVKWDGSSWQSVGTGLNSAVYTIASASDGLYVGGAFTSTGSRIAKWDGSNWSAVGSGFNNAVRSIFSGSDGLYIGGDFSTPSSHVAKYNGSYVAIGSINNTVYSIFSGSDGVYAGGQFAYADGNPANCVAKWNGSGWSALSGGTGPTVYSIISGSDGVYAGGNFSSTGSNIAKWDGNNWSSLSSSPNNTVLSIVSNSSGVCIGGSFNNLGTGIARWNGNSWESFKLNFNDSVKTLHIASNIIYAGGNFTNTDSRNINNFIYNKYNKGDLITNNILEQNYYTTNDIFYNIQNISLFEAKENNIYNIKKDINYQNNFVGISPIYSPRVYSCHSASEGVYVGGFFYSVNGTYANNIAKWNGQSWSSLGSGLGTTNYDSVNAIISGSDGIYAVLNTFFTTNGVNKWDGFSWSSVGTTSQAASLISCSNGLYVGDVNGFLKYNGTNWVAITSGLFPSGLAGGPVNSIISGSDGIYLGGQFNPGSANVLVNICKWDGTEYQNFNIGLNNAVYAIASGSDGIYVGGKFTSDFNNTITLNKIAKWDGSNWTAVGSGLNGNVRALYFYNNELYIGGDFTADYNNTISLNNVAKWDGSNFKQIGSLGTRNGFNTSYNDTVYGFATGNPDQLYILGWYDGTRSGIKFIDSKYKYSTEGYYVSGAALLMPTPQLTFNNFIPPSEADNMNLNEVIYDQNGNVASITKTSGYHSVKTINENYVYEVDKISGKKPFYDSYADFAEQLKALSLKHSLVPEYTISDYMKTYVKEKNGNFTQPLENDYLKIDGGLTQQGFSSINTAINVADNVKNNLVFDSTNNNSDINFTLNISGIKKLLPYRGFYPSERVVQLAGDFINSFLNLDTPLTSNTDTNLIFSSSLSNGTPINQQILTLLQPIMAPGVLLNTIKSSIAVDWPVFITSSVSYDSLTKPEFYANTGSELITNVVYNPITNQYANYTASNYIDKEQNYRFPFESLLEFDIIEQELVKDINNLYYLNPTYYTSDIITGSDSHLFAYPSYNMGTGSIKPFVFQDNNYKLGMHNFLAEIPNFFLKGKLTNIVSQPESKFRAAKSGVTYYMDVVLEKDSKYKEFVADPYNESLKKQTVYQSDGTYLLPSADSLYGPPTRYWNDVNPNAFFDKGPYNFYSKLLDTPAYAPYVPPYYYGKAVARISFTPSESRKYTLAEIQASCSIEYLNEEARALFEQRSNFISGNFNGPFNDNYSSSPAYKQMMTLSASVNLLGIADQKSITYDISKGSPIQASDKINPDPLWIIQTKFETPSINFNKVDLTDNFGFKKVAGQTGEGIYSYLFKGMWTSYGEPVKDGQGIKLYLQESFKEIGDLTGSLIKLCGFTNFSEKKTVGLLAESKKINEGVVIIPYTFVDNNKKIANENFATTLREIIGENGIYSEAARGSGPYYYRIDPTVISKLLGGINFGKASFEQIRDAAAASQYQDNSIVKMINSMVKYVIPPHLDWLRNKNITPFVMYIADFSTTFDKQDLSDIWQGLMPKQAYNTQIEDIKISHNFGPDEMFHGKRPLDDTKYKVFKVKQRANINYYKLTDDSRDDDRFKFTFGNSQQATVPDYSYNWPYDYFSLVELVNIEASLAGKNEPPQPKETIINPERVVKALLAADPQKEIKSLSDKIDISSNIKPKIQ